jgi:hypothetical protein
MRYFNDYLNEQLEDPEFKEKYERGKERFNLEIKFNEMLRDMGKEDLFVEVKEISEY